MTKALASQVSKPVGHVVICGGGLAGSMVAAALVRHLPRATQITHITDRLPPAADIFYGSVTAPSAYDFNLSVGASEPRLVLESRTAFSLGTQYQDWGAEKRSWVQGFQLPLPVLNGVAFHQYLVRQQIGNLEPFLISATAAKRGAFAHPPENAGHPLARAEYGYQFEAESYARLFARLAETSRIRAVFADVTDVQCHAVGIEALRLSDGQTVTADLFIDCTGPEALLLSKLGSEYRDERRLSAAFSLDTSDALGPAVRTVKGHAFGWQSITPLQGARAKLTISTPEDEATALARHGETPQIRATALLGRQSLAWLGNCVAIGQSAAMLEPLTPAPVMLLQKDIGRLMTLIPLSGDMTVERREFNRQFIDDYEHAELFRRALFATAPLPRSSYWETQMALASSPKLERKIGQYLSRGVLVAYDLEPFTPEDWVMLHFGMGRHPRRHDRLADQVPLGEMQQYLQTLEREVDAAARSLPGHNSYMSNLKRYLTREGA